MENYIPKTFRQFLALLLCAAMLLPNIPVSAFATEVTEPVDETVSVVSTEAPTEAPEDATEAATSAPTEAPAEETEAPVEETEEAPEEETVPVEEDETESDAVDAANDYSFTILAGSDFQAISGTTWQAANDIADANMTAIMEQVMANHTVDAFLFGGDYSSALYRYSAPTESGETAAQLSQAGYDRLIQVLNRFGLKQNEIPMYFAQGNHDPVGLDFITPTLGYGGATSGGYDHDQFGVFVLNFDDFISEIDKNTDVSSTEAENRVKAAAADLKTWLAGQTVGAKPIFILSHLPLHQSIRALEKGDAQYAKYIVDELNAAGKRGLNIIFLYSHNHEEKNSQYMGGSTNFVARGESIWVPNTAGTTLTPNKQTIYFTYMNAGFSSWYGAWSTTPAVTDDMTMSVFQISGDDVRITRYNADGVFPLQEKAGTFYVDAEHNEATYGYTVDATVQKSPYTVRGDADVIISEDSGAYFYKLSNGLKHGRYYVIATSAEEKKTTGLHINWTDGSTLQTITPEVAIYNSSTPYLLISDGLNPSVQQNETFLFSDPDGDGYGTLTDENGHYLAIQSSMWDADTTFVQAAMASSYADHPSFRWTYVEGTNAGSGLISQQEAYNDKPIQLAHFDGIHENVDHDEWITVRTSDFNPNLFLEVLIYERTPLTYTLELSDKVGEVPLNGTETGTMIVKTWATGQIEYIPVTVSMLSVGASTAGTFNNVTVTMADGTVVASDYTLVVGGGNTITVDEGYYYRLTDQFVEGVDFSDEQKHNYLILDRNDRGNGVMLESNGFSDSSVLSTDVVVTLDADGVPAVLSENVERPTYQEWWKHKHSDGIWYLWQPNFTGAGNGSNNFLRINIAPYYNVLTGSNDGHAMTGPNVGQSDSYSSSTCQNYTTIRGNVSAFDGVTMYIQYNPESQLFEGNIGADRREGREVYIYEKVTYNTATVAPSGTRGHVAAGSAISSDTMTGSGIVITYPDGQVESVRVSTDMLYKANGEQLTAQDISAAREITGLTVKYEGATVTTNYTLVVHELTDGEPEYPLPGSVKVDKQLNTDEYNFAETGVARVDLSTTGIPAGKLDILVIVDTSGSVGMYRLDDGRVRIELIRDALAELIDTLAEPHADGTMPDVTMAITEFSDYNWFSSPNTLNAMDGHDHKPAEERYSDAKNNNIDENRLVQYYTDIQEMQNFDLMQLKPNGGTNYDAAMQVAYQTIEARKAELAAVGDDREQIVIFMTDGMTYQYNYMSLEENADTHEYWGKWLEGTLTDDELHTYFPEAAWPFYNPYGQNWIAEAIKGTGSGYKAIWNDELDANMVAYDPNQHLRSLDGLGATIYSIGFGVYVEGENSVRVSNSILSKIASDPDKFYEAQDGDDLLRAFSDISHTVRNAATNAEFRDQMGDAFDLQMGTVVNSRGQTVNLKPTITIKAYDLYTMDEVDTYVNGKLVTEDMVGQRKSNAASVVLETVTFNEAGTEAYSNKVDVNGDGKCDTADNIMVNGVINAKYFQYNTNKEQEQEDPGFVELAYETFKWNVGTITEREYVLSYYVYLENSMGEDQVGVDAGTYDTNNYANLSYTNYLGEDCEKETESPNRTWENAQVTYKYYLVDANGNPIINETTGETGAFAVDNVIVVGASTTTGINLNVDVTVLPESGVPKGYALYDLKAGCIVHANSFDSTVGTTGGKLDFSGDTTTTYVTGIGGDSVNTDKTATSGDYTDTTVWFAIVKLPEPELILDKTVEATTDPNEFILTLDAYATGSEVTITRPADIVLVLDHSASMRTPVGAPNVLQSGTWYGGEGQLTKSDLSTTQGALPGYYVAQDSTDNYWYVLLYHTDNCWYGYKVKSTEGVIEYYYENGDAAQKDGKYADHISRHVWNTASDMPDTFVFYKSQYAALYESVKEFVAELKASGVDHRVAITGFSGSTFGGSVLYLYTSGYETVHYLNLQNLDQATRTAAYQLALKEIQDATEYAELQTAIDKIDTRYIFTCPAVGLRMATDLFAANDVDLEERDRVVILFTDGIPNKMIGSNQNNEDNPTDIYNEIVSIAKEAKDQGAKIYTISTTTLSEGADRSFLHYASSDYPDATNWTNHGDPISNQMYTMRVQNMEDFGLIFNSITQDIANSGTNLGTQAVLKEVLTDYFVLNPDDEVDISVYTQKAKADGTFDSTLVPFTGAKVTLSSSEGTDRMDTIEVSGFDYNAEFVSKNPRTGSNGESDYYGSKLVVKVRIRTRDGFWGGNNVPTNKSETAMYSDGMLMKPFPMPEVNVPIHVEVTAKDKTIYYDGNIDTDGDGKEGDELIDSIIIGTQKDGNGKIVNGSTVTINSDGSLTPQQDWMDDFANASWAEGSTKPDSDLSSTEPQDYTYEVVVTPKYEGEEPRSNNPGNIAGNVDGGDIRVEDLAVPSQGTSGSDEGHIYILVPELTFEDSTTYYGDDAGDYEYTQKDYVSTVWKDMEHGKQAGDGIPDVDEGTEIPELTLTYIPDTTGDNALEDGKFVTDTKVEVTVQMNEKNITDLTKFKWQADCTFGDHTDDMDISDHAGNGVSNETTGATNEFWVHVEVTAQVSGKFYLVDENGNPIKADGTSTDFANSEKLGDLQTVPVSDAPVTLDAEELLTQAGLDPDVYELYDPSADYTLTYDQQKNDGSGSWEITVGAGKETTYVDNYGNGKEPTTKKSNTATGTDGQNLSNTTVYFAVRYKVKPDTVVIDFGLQVEIDVLSNDNFAAVDGKQPEVTGIVKKTGEGLPVNGATNKADGYANTADGEYGKLTVLESDMVEYSIDSMEMPSEDVFIYEAKYNGKYFYSTVTVIPATTIYYEDSFISYSTWKMNDDGTTEKIDSTWTATDPNAETPDQAQDRPGALNANDAGNIYGYDGAYLEMGTDSMGSSMMVTVTPNVFAEAQFTFWGTGFDVISRTTNTTGTILVDIYNADAFAASRFEADVLHSYMVDTYYGYKYAKCKVTYMYTSDNGTDWYWKKVDVVEATAEDETLYDSNTLPATGTNKQEVIVIKDEWVVNTQATGGLYQIPVMQVENLNYGHYTAVITVWYDEYMDHQNPDAQTGSYDFYLDAIRIYDPANDGDKNEVIENAYKADGEGWPEYFELRNLVINREDFDALSDGQQKTGVIFIDNTLLTGSTGYSIDDYTHYGPNNELYLAPGQSVAFNLNVTDTNLAQIHLAMKSVGGTAYVKYYDAKKTTEAKTTQQTIATATDLYYNITSLNNGTVVIKNTGSSGILSITNIKLTYSSAHTDRDTVDFITVDTASAANVLSSMTPIVPEVVPQAIFEGTNMTLGNSLALNFWIKNGALEGEDYYAEITRTYGDGKADTTVQVPFKDWPYSETNKMYYISYEGIAAKEMNDEITVIIYKNDGTQVSVAKTDSVVDYVNRNIAKWTNAKLLATVVDMLNYGAAAQEYFHYDEENLANASITDYQQYATQTAEAEDIRVAGANYAGSTLTLESRIVLTMYFRNVTRDMTAEISYVDHYGHEMSYTVAGSEFVENSGLMGVAVDTLVVADGGQSVTCVVYDADGNEVGRATDSVESYAARMSNLSELIEMIVKFSASSYAYFH